MTFTHAVAMTVLGVVGVIVAFWILGSLAGIIFFFVKIAVVVALIAAVFWVVSRLTASHPASRQPRARGSATAPDGGESMTRCRRPQVGVGGEPRSGTQLAGTRSRV